MNELTIRIPYSEYSQLNKDSVDKQNIITLLNQEFPDETCQLIAIKAILGI